MDGRFRNGGGVDDAPSDAPSGQHPTTLLLGSQNARGCSTSEDKRCEIGEMFVRKKLDVCALSETKMKGKGECKFGDVEGRMSGVLRGRAREGVAILLSKRVLRRVVEWKEVSSRLMWVRVKWGKENWVFVSAYGPGSERNEEERESFWNSLSECLGQFKTWQNVVIMGDLNARVGDVMVDNVIGRYGVAGVNESGRRCIEMCNEYDLVVGNTLFKKKRINKYTWVRTSSGKVVDKALMDYVLIDRKVVGRLLDVHVSRGEHGGISDHYLILSKLRVSPRGVCWRSWRGRKGAGREIVKVSALNDADKEREFEIKVREELEELNVGEMTNVEAEWGRFSETLVRCAVEVCGKRKVGRGVRKGSEWWNENVREAVNAKKRAFEDWLRRGCEEAHERYRNERRKVKWTVKVAKREADEKFGRRISDNFKENKKMFWKEVKRVKGGDSNREESVKDKRGKLLVDNEAVKLRWAEHFDSLFNVVDERVAKVVVTPFVGSRGRRVDGSENEKIDAVEVRKAIAEMKSGKAPGMDGCTVEYLKKGGEAVVLWLVSFLNLCFSCGKVPSDWCNACIVPLYKGKGDKYECSNYRGISLLCVVGKLYGRILMKRIRELTDSVMGEEQCGFRRGRGCVDQIFTVKQLCEKYARKGRTLYWAFMDLEKAYDRVDRDALWEVMRIYGVGGRLLRAVKSFYVDSKACVRVGNETSEWFSVKTGVRQGCVISPWLFNIFMDGVMREVSARVPGGGVELTDCKGDVVQVSQLLFADDTALVAESEERLRRLVVEFGRVCERRKLKVNVGKSKVMKCGKDTCTVKMNVTLGGQVLEEVNVFKYLGSNVVASSCEEVEVCHRINEGSKMMGVLKQVVRNKNLSMNAKRCLYERVVVPTVTYGAETWNLREIHRKKLNVFEMRCLRGMVGVTRLDKVRNEIVRRRAGVREDMAARVDKSVLRWFGHLERMDENRLVRKIWKSEVDGKCVRGRPNMRWMDGVKRALYDRGISVEEARVSALKRNEWRAIVRN